MAPQKKELRCEIVKRRVSRNAPGQDYFRRLEAGEESKDSRGGQMCVPSVEVSTPAGAAPWESTDGGGTTPHFTALRLWPEANQVHCLARAR